MDEIIVTVDRHRKHQCTECLISDRVMIWMRMQCDQMEQRIKQLEKQVKELTDKTK